MPVQQLRARYREVYGEESQQWAPAAPGAADRLAVAGAGAGGSDGTGGAAGAGTGQRCGLEGAGAAGWAARRKAGGDVRAGGTGGCRLPAAVLRRSYRERTVEVKVLAEGFEYEGQRYESLSAVARAITGHALEWPAVLRADQTAERRKRMVPAEPTAKPVRCAIYTRTSSEERLSQEFNSLEAQRECGEAYIRSQRQAGWTLLPARYDDGGYTGANLERPALERLLADMRAEAIDCVVLYKVDRLSRSLFDFARLMQMFEEQGVSFVSVTQQFNSSTPMGRLTLHVLLSFAEFERDLVSERTRDKKGAARRKGKWMGGTPMLGYDVDGQSRLQVNEAEAAQVREIFGLFVGTGSLEETLAEMAARGWRQKAWTDAAGEGEGRPGI